MNNEPANGGETEKGKKKDSFRTLFFKFAAMSWTYWFATCFVSYQTIFLQSIGWNAAKVGVINSINSTVGVFSTPFWGTLSDKIRSVKKIIVVLIIASALTYLSIPYMDFRIAGLSFLFIIIPISGFFKTPLSSLIDNWTVRACNQHGLHFGAIRSFGSISYGIIGLILGYVITKLNGENGNRGTRLTFLLYAFFMIGLLIAVLLIREDLNDGSASRKHQKLSEMQFGRLFKNYYYMTYLIYAMLIQIPLSCVYSFLPYLMAEVDVPTGMIGYITGFKAFIEVPMLLLMDKVRNKVPLYFLLFGSGFFYLCEAFGYSICGNFWQIVLISTFQGLGGGLHIAAGSNYVATLSPSNLKATAQTLNGSMVSLSGILGSLVGGFLINSYGIRSFYRLSAVLIAFSLIIYICSFPFGEKVLHIPRPGIVRHGKKQ